MRDSRVRLRNELVKALIIDPDYPVPGNLGYYPPQIGIEQTILHDQMAADRAKAVADRLEKIAYGRDKMQKNYSEMRAALILERHFQLRMRRRYREERGGTDFFDDKGSKWDFTGTGADELMNYDGFMTSLKIKIAKSAVDKIGVDTRSMGDKFARNLMRDIQILSDLDQNDIVKNKIVIISTDGKVIGIDR